jgi:hypothetical protein
MRPEERLKLIASELRGGEKVPPVSVREFVSWFGVERRGSWIVRDIRRKLRKAELVTEPDFDSVYIDSEISFQLSSGKDQPVLDHEKEQTPSTIIVTTANYFDPTYRMGKLPAANKAPVRVTPDATLGAAVTLMMANDFSQLPVMTSEREVKGIVSWNSIGTRLALGKAGNSVRDFQDIHQEVRSDLSLFDAIPMIAQHNYVLVRGKDKVITGIVTASDLSVQFMQLAEPFLLLAEIENHIRRLLSHKFSKEDSEGAKDPADKGRKIEDVNDLSLGEYLRLLGNDDKWKKLGVMIDRVSFCEQLNSIRRLRNDIMHFDPDPIPADELDRLRDFSGFLQRLQQIGIP